MDFKKGKKMSDLIRWSLQSNQPDLVKYKQSTGGLMLEKFSVVYFEDGGVW
jgi:hypothetical protein